MKHAIRLRVGGNLFNELDYGKNEQPIQAYAFLFNE